VTPLYAEIPFARVGKVLVETVVRWQAGGTMRIKWGWGRHAARAWNVQGTVLLYSGMHDAAGHSQMVFALVHEWPCSTQ